MITTVKEPSKVTQYLMILNDPAEKISRPLERLKKKCIEVIRGEIDRIDPTERQAF
jgi:hypothetical protein